MSPRLTQMTRYRSWLSSCVVGAVVAVSLSGCGGASDPAEFNEATTVLTKKQLSSAMLSADDLGRGFVVLAEPGESSDSPAPGCLGRLSKTTGPDPAAEVQKNFQRTGKVPFPVVMFDLASFESADQVTESLEIFKQAIDDCSHLKWKSKDGVSFDIKMSTDNVPSTKAVDEQYNARGIGTATTKKLKVPYGIWYSMARVGNQGVAVMVMDFNPDSGALLNKYTAKAVERLHLVAQGKAPDEKKKPAKPKPTDKAKSNA